MIWHPTEISGVFPLKRYKPQWNCSMNWKKATDHLWNYPRFDILLRNRGNISSWKDKPHLFHSMILKNTSNQCPYYILRGNRVPLFRPFWQDPTFSVGSHSLDRVQLFRQDLNFPTGSRFSVPHFREGFPEACPVFTGTWDCDPVPVKQFAVFWDMHDGVCMGMGVYILCPVPSNIMK